MESSSEGVRFKLFGVPVLIRQSFWFVSLFFGLSAAGGRFDADGILILGSTVAVVTISILIHEFGHAIAMMRYNFRPNIELHSMGGLAHFGGSGRLTRKAAIIVSLAGPAAGLLAGLAMLPVKGLLSPGSPVVLQVVVSMWLWVNLAWSLFNLLPILPMDGGRVAEDLMSTRPQGWQGARRLSIATAAVVVVAALFYQKYFIAMMVAWFGGFNYQQLKEARATSMLRRPDLDP